MAIRIPQYEPSTNGVAPVSARLEAYTYQSGIGAAAEGLGKEMAAGGGHLHELEVEKDKSAVLTAVTNAGIELSDISSEFRNLTLDAAGEGQGDFTQRMQQRVDERMTELGNPRQQRYFKEAMTPLLGRSISELNGHARTEMHKAVGSALETSLATQKELIDRTENLAMKDEIVQETRGLIVEQLRYKGLVTDDNIDEPDGQLAIRNAMLDFTDSVQRATVSKMLVEQYPDFDMINAHLRAYSDQMRPETITSVMQQLKPALEARIEESDMDSTMLFADEGSSQAGDVEEVGSPESDRKAGGSGGVVAKSNRVAAAPNPVGPPDVINYFSSRLPAHVAAGVVGGIMSESSGDDKAFNGAGGGQGAHGLGQHRGPRLAEMRRRYGPNPTRQQQMEFILWELKGGDTGGRKVLEAKTAEEAAAAYIEHFMRPSQADMAGGIKRAVAAATGGKGKYDAAASGAAFDPASGVPDRERIMKAIDRQAADGKWTLERKRAVQNGWDRRINMAEGILNDKRRGAEEALTAHLVTLGPDGFTNMSQLPADLVAQASPSFQLQLQNRAAANKAALEGATVPANGARALWLEQNLLSAEMNDAQREAWKDQDLSIYRNEVTPSEYSAMVLRQQKLKAGRTGQHYAENVTTELNRWSKFYRSEELSDLNGLRVQSLMLDYMQRTLKGGVPHAKDWQDAYRYATREVPMVGTGLFNRGTTSSKPVYKDETANLNEHTRGMLIRRLVDMGYPATTDNMKALWDDKPDKLTK